MSFLGGVNLIVVILLVCVPSRLTGAETKDLIANGGFETGDLTSWIASETGDDDPQSCDTDWTIQDSGKYPPCYGYYLPVSPHGDYAAYNSFDSSMPGRQYILHQLIKVPSDFTSALLSLEFGYAWNMSVYGATLPREFRVELRSSEGEFLNRLHTTTLRHGTKGSVNWQGIELDISEILKVHHGKEIGIYFINHIPEAYVGSASFGLDEVSLAVTLPDKPVAALNPPMKVFIEEVTFDVKKKIFNLSALGKYLTASISKKAGAKVMVNVDGSASYDPNQQPLRYVWGWIDESGSSFSAETFTPSLQLELAAGITYISLMVENGIEVSLPVATYVEVVQVDLNALEAKDLFVNGVGIKSLQMAEDHVLLRLDRQQLTATLTTGKDVEVLLTGSVQGKYTIDKVIATKVKNKVEKKDVKKSLWQMLNKLLQKKSQKKKR